MVLGGVVNAVKKQKGAIIVTADHGNCEKMWEDATDEPHTAHTLNKVPMILADFSGPKPPSTVSASCIFTPPA